LLAPNLLIAGRIVFNGEIKIVMAMIMLLFGVILVVLVVARNSSQKPKKPRGYLRQAKPDLNFNRPAPQNNNAYPVDKNSAYVYQVGKSCINDSSSEHGTQNVPAKPTDWSLDLLQQIEWKVFEDLSAAYYKEKGIRAELTKLGADGGIDIKLFQDESGKPTSLVQCKAWNSQLVGVKAIREFLGVITHEKVAKGFFMASKGFTPDAVEIAKANRIILVDGYMFLTMIKRLPVDAQQRLLVLATQGDYKTPSCPSCGIKMIRREGKRGAFWGCRNYPKCRQILHAK
jgi:restriction system protein